MNSRIHRDKRLEDLSDKVRSGEPIEFAEAIEVINYQENLQRERTANSFVARLKRFFRIGAAP